MYRVEKEKYVNTTLVKRELSVAESSSSVLRKCTFEHFAERIVGKIESFTLSNAKGGEVSLISPNQSGTALICVSVIICDGRDVFFIVKSA